MSRIIWCSTVALLLGATLLAPAIAGTTEDGITLRDGWLRLIVHTRPAAGYFTLDNAADQPKTLTDADSPACGQLELHRSLHDSGQERMVMVKQVTVPAHGSLRFVPGDYHLMCMRPTSALNVGGKVPVTLHFADGGSVTAAFSVRGPDSP